MYTYMLKTDKYIFWDDDREDSKANCFPYTSAISITFLI